MIVMPSGWTTVQHMDGLELLHPAGRAVATIEYRERMRPLARAGTIVKRALATLPGFTCELPDVVERLTTFEGEHAAVASLPGEHHGHTAQLELGMVFGDDFYALATGLCHQPDQFDTLATLVRDLVISDTHALGVRRRRFEYAPPRGWQGLARGFVTDWFPADYPRDSLHFTAFPANPRRFTPNEIFAISIGRDRQVVRDSSSPVHLANGLAGAVFEAELAGTRPIVKVIAALEDARYSYVLEITAGGHDYLAGHREELEQVIASIQPVPQAQEARSDHHYAVQSHWIE